MVSSMTGRTVSFPELLQKVHAIGVEVLAPAAASVDHEARFPHEAIDALRRERLLAAYIPAELGGLSCSISELVAIAQVLGQYCASSAMVWTMHQIQVACLVHHGTTPFFQQYVREIAEQQLLLASITSEVGVGGDVRTSIAAIESETDQLRKLFKKSTAISYGEYADGFLATARRSVDAASSDQVFVLLHRSESELVTTGKWNPLGMRGTCSPAFTIASTFSAEHIFPMPFADISAQTMVPFSHLLWSACWQGIATEALARARKFMHGKARQLRVTALPGDGHLVEAAGLLQTMRSTIQETLREYETMLLDWEQIEDASSDLGFAIKLNNVKLLSSQLVVQIVQQALYICGMAGYSEDSPFSVARHLRDAYSASLMINNDRLAITNAALLLMHREQ
jgi:acyl-CoA dehydrogenase